MHAAGELEVSASHPTASCTVPLAEPPIEAEHVSVVEIVCG
ncbi:MAG TPA: hypothetical protein VG755_28535 [Nannocystaceae bacterium]|nr:hypothetical protein [Nannocystaceae bacterium]